MNSKVLSDPSDLRPWLLPEGSTPADIYAVGLQEIVDLNVMNVVIKNSASDEMAAHWLRSVNGVLASSGSSSRYKLLVERHMVGILFVLFAKESLFPCISELRYAVTYTGSYGVTGNKGGISVHMRVHDSPLCFVCAHFHANRENVATRNLDFQHIMDQATFVPCAPGTCGSSSSGSTSAHASKKEQTSKAQSSGSGAVNTAAAGGRSINNNAASGAACALHEGLRTGEEEAPSGIGKGGESRIGASSSGAGGDGVLCVAEHEHVFWLGDLNYRIVEELSTRDVFECLHVALPAAATAAAAENTAAVSSSKKALAGGSSVGIGNNSSNSSSSTDVRGGWEWLRHKDQLNVERHRQNVFQGFEEGPLSFPPTYKYQPGTNLYEARPDKKLRAPAWCDRVLWRSRGRGGGAGSVQQLHYRCASELVMSDHKPVSALFGCEVRKVVPERLRAVHQELLVTVDKWINASAPKISLEGRIIDLGEIRFNVSNP